VRRAVLELIPNAASATEAVRATEGFEAALDTLPEGRTPTKRDWERLSSSWRQELDERIATLEAIRGRLTTCIGCGCLSFNRCQLSNPNDRAARLGPGPRYWIGDRPRT